MMRNIVACSDGTGNTAVKGRGSNVFKLYEAVSLNDGDQPEQVAIYDDGVGTQNFRLFRMATGAFGYGLKRNVRQLYIEISRAYKPGDKIYLFGFSRGAFTVRMLAGLIVTQGLINCAKVTPTKLDNHARAAQRRLLHNHLKQAVLQRFFGAIVSWFVRSIRVEYEHENFVHHDGSSHSASVGPGKDVIGVDVAFIGAWDTVDAIGLPMPGLRTLWNAFIYKFRFPDQLLHSRVHSAAHALAIDDERATFHPTVWDEAIDSTGRNPRIDQVWFAGVHSNVGGGYPKQGMSLVTLEWMMERACFSNPTQPIRFDPNQVASIKARANVDGQLYDSRSGLRRFYRYKPRSISEICTAHNMPVRIHRSALHRVLESKVAGYAPGNFPESFVAVGDVSRLTSIPKGMVKVHGISKSSDVQSYLQFWILLRQFVPWAALAIGVISAAFLWRAHEKQNTVEVYGIEFSRCLGMIDCSVTIFASNALLICFVGLLATGLMYLCWLATKRIRNQLVVTWEVAKVLSIQQSYSNED